MSNPLALASYSSNAMSESANVGELGSGWRCVKSEDYGQTYIFEPALPSFSPTPGPVPTPWGPSYPMGMAQAMSAESTARNRATLEEATNSAHFESTFFMSPLGGDGYGKTSRDIPSTVAPGKAAPALGAFEHVSSKPYITASGLVTQPTAQIPMITGGGALPLGYATGGASALGLVNSTTGGLALTTDQMGSWMVMGQPNNHVQMHIPQLLPGGEQRLSINNNQPPGVNDSQAYAQAQSQANALSQLHTLQRLAALNRARMGYMQ